MKGNMISLYKITEWVKYIKTTDGRQGTSSCLWPLVKISVEPIVFWFLFQNLVIFFAADFVLNVVKNIETTKSQLLEFQNENVAVYDNIFFQS